MSYYFPDFFKYSKNGKDMDEKTFVTALLSTGGFQRDADVQYLHLVFFLTDVDGSGSISIAEFDKIKTAYERMMRTKGAVADSLKYFVFCVLDSDRSEQVDAREIKRLVQFWGRKGDLETCRQHINLVDSNQNGTMGFEEFLKFWP